jgi:hypothetical protein
MKSNTKTPGFRFKRHFYIFKRLLIMANLLALSLYIILRVIFYDLPFVMEDELMQVLNAAGIASVVAVGVSLVLLASDVILFLIRKRKHTGQQAVVPGTVYTLSGNVQQDYRLTGLASKKINQASLQH